MIRMVWSPLLALAGLMPVLIFWSLLPAVDGCAGEPAGERLPGGVASAAEAIQLARQGEPAIPIIIGALERGDPNRQYWAIWCLARMGPRTVGVAAKIASFLNDERKELQAVSFLALCAILDDVDEVIRLSSGADKNLRSWAIARLGNPLFAPQDAGKKAQALVRQLDDPQTFEPSLKALLGLGHEAQDAAGALAKVLAKEKDPARQVQITGVLNAIRPPSAEERDDWLGAQSNPW